MIEKQNEKIEKEINELKNSIDLTHPEILTYIKCFEHLNTLENSEYKIRCFKAFKAYYNSTCFFHNTKFFMKKTPLITFFSRDFLSKRNFINYIIDNSINSICSINNYIYSLEERNENFVHIFFGINKNGIVIGFNHDIDENKLLEKLKSKMQMYLEGKKEILLERIFIRKFQIKSLTNENLFILDVNINYYGIIPKLLFNKKNINI